MSPEAAAVALLLIATIAVAVALGIGGLATVLVGPRRPGAIVAPALAVFGTLAFLALGAHWTERDLPRVVVVAGAVAIVVAVLQRVANRPESPGPDDQPTGRDILDP